MKKQKFTTELITGHGGVCAVIVPFDPAQVWGVTLTPMMTSHGKRLGTPVQGTVNGAPFEYWLGYRWGRFFIILEESLQRRAGISAGDLVQVVVEPQPGVARVKQKMAAKNKIKATSTMRRKTVAKRKVRARA
ncbi:MAG: DUF1905 domain-containing protein [Myxococcota bacterium]